MYQVHHGIARIIIRTWWRSKVVRGSASTNTSSNFSIEAGEGLLVELKVKGSITELISRLLGKTSSETRQKACFDEETSKTDSAKHSSILETAVSRSTLDNEISTRDRTLQCTAEQILEVPVPETMK